MNKLEMVLLIIGGITSFVFAQSPGIVVGTTHIDQQSIGSTGNRVAVGSDGSVFFAWMNALNYQRPRHIYFNRRDNQWVWYSTWGGDRVFNDSVTGYCQVAMAYGNHGVTAAHAGASLYSEIAIDSDPPGYGIFNTYNAPDLVSDNGRTLWPYVAVDRNNLVHLVMTENSEDQDPQRLCYARFNLSNTSWWPNAINPQYFDSVKTISSVIAASPVSDKVVIAYTRMVDTSIQLWNDVYYILSQDGVNWDFINGKTNITNYTTDNDSLWAFTDLALIFDYNDNFHIAWNANWSSTPDAYNKKTFLFHYNYATQNINQIRSPWPNYNWPDSGCTIGAWNRPICKMDFGVRQADNRLYAIWTQFDTSDCSAGGCANGDIWSANLSNGGQTWTLPENLTNSHTPGCTSGNCDNDSWGSLGDVVNYKMHLFYVNSKSECNHGDTISYMLYYDLPAAIGFPDEKPSDFSLSLIYPNPFNAKTSISYTLKNSADINLDVYNILGEKVANLFKGKQNLGTHKLCWNAEKYPSGVYFAVLSSQSDHQVKQLTLIK